MQNDFPLTLNHIRRRLRSCNRARGRDAQARTALSQRATHAELTDARRPARTRAARLGRRAGRARRHVRLEQPAPLRAVLRDPVHGRGAAHAQHPPVRGAADLHRQPRRGPGDLRRRLARADRSRSSRRACDGVEHYVVMGDGRRRAASCRTCCATRSCSRTPAPAASTTPSWTSARRRRCATRAAPPATPRACSTRTARSACTPRRR